MRNQKGFTLVEMLVVLLIISVLILITVPNVTKHFETVDTKGCEAYIKMVQGQVEAYKMEKLEYPTDVYALMNDDYLPKLEEGQTPKCPNGQEIEINNGLVQIKQT